MMKIYTEIEFKITEDGLEEVRSSSFEYDGPVAEVKGPGDPTPRPDLSGQFNENTGRINLTNPNDMNGRGDQYSYDPVTGFIHQDTGFKPDIQPIPGPYQPVLHQPSGPLLSDIGPGQAARGQAGLEKRIISSAIGPNFGGITAQPISSSTVIKPDDKRYGALRDEFIKQFQDKNVGSEYLLGNENPTFTSFGGLTEGQNRLSSNISDLTSQYGDLSTGLSNVQDTVGNVQTGLSDLAADYQNLGNKFEDYNNQFGDFRSAYDKQMSDYGTRFDQMSQGIGSLTSDYDDMQDKMQTIENTSADFSEAVVNRFGQVEGRVGSLEDKVNINPYYGAPSSGAYGAGYGSSYQMPMNFGTGYNIGGYNSTGYYSPTTSWLGGLGY